MTNQEKISVGAMGLFTEELRMKTPHELIKWFWNNQADFQREELAHIVNQLLIGIAVDMEPNKACEMLHDIAIELDDEYDDAYGSLSETE